ncbi:MAG: PAS domain-containing sensor histidine kinase [Chitinophagaceae bacterium]
MKNRTTSGPAGKTLSKKQSIHPKPVSRPLKTISAAHLAAADTLFGSKNKSILNNRSALELVLKRNELLRLASAVAKLGYFELNRKTLKMNWSSHLLDIFEAKEGCEPLMGNEECNYIFEEDYPDVIQAFKNAMQGKYNPITYRIKTSSGKVKTLQTTFSGMNKNVDKDIIFGTTQDISIIKRKEDEVLNKERELRSITDSAPVLIIKATTNGTIQYINGSQRKRIGEKVSGIFYAKNHNLLQQKIELAIKSGKAVNFEMKAGGRQKKIIYYNTTVKRVEYPNKPSSLIFIVQDITGLKEVNQLVSNAIAEAEVKERDRIAADLHDGVCQHLATVHLSIDTIQKMLKENDPAIGDFITETKELVAETLSIARKVSHDLMPVDLLNSGFLKGIKAMISRLNRVDKIKYNLTVLGKEKEFLPNVSNNLYRIIQEFIHNSEKHSEATDITLYIRYGSRHAEVKISDNGKGFNPDKVKKPGGIGLQSMLNRVRTLSNDYNYKAEEENGVSLYINIPLYSI